MSESALEAMSREELLILGFDLLKVNAEQQRRIERLEEEVAQLKGGAIPNKTPQEPPAFVRPNVQKDQRQPKPPRKKRSFGYVRRTEEPTRVVEHFPLECSCCGRKLQGGWLHSSRQVLEIPTTPIEVIEHRFMARYCGVCRHREVARVEMEGAVLGQSRIGVRLASLICYLDTVCRLPVGSIQRSLWGLYGLHLSQGEIVRVQDAVAQAGEGSYNKLLEEIRCSPVVHADETGSRQDGQNGYLWSLSTPEIRFYHRSKSRAAEVIRGLLNYEPLGRSLQSIHAAIKVSRETPTQRFMGKLVTDFYCAYSWYSGVHQRCLVHLDRDLDELKARYALDPDVCEWVERVLGLIEQAKDYAKQQRERQATQPSSPQHSLSQHSPSQHSPSQHPPKHMAAIWQPPDGRLLRRRRRLELERQMLELARPYCRSALPQRVLAERISKHLRQLFVFVEYLDVPSDNNAAERAVRSYVVQRKISGGTRSEKGSKTQVVLLSLFQTWQLRGEDLLNACQQLLAGRTARAPC